MRRPSAVCQRAVRAPAPYHVWVPDDLLSLAAHRFFPAPSPRHHRNASNVPGPLEARRRATKRPMTVSAGFQPADIFPLPTFSLSSLLGLGATPQKLPTWRYEPPSLPRSAAPLSPPASWTAPSHLHVASSSNTQPIAEDLPTAADASTASHSNNVDYETAFHSFKAKIKKSGIYSVRRRNQLLRKAYLAFLPVGSDAWRYNVLVLRHVVEGAEDWGWSYDAILQYPRDFATPPLDSREWRELLDCLQIIWSRSPEYHQLQKLLKQLAQSLLLCTDLQYNQYNLSYLIRQLWQSTLLRKAKTRPAVADLIVGLSQKFKHRDLARLFNSIISDPANLQTQITYAVTRVAETPDHISFAEDALFCIPERLRRNLVEDVSLYFAKTLHNKPSSSHNIHIDRMNAWLRLVQNIDSKSGFKDSLLELALASLLPVHPRRGSNRFRPEIFTHALLFKASQHEAFQNERASSFIEAYSSAMWDQSNFTFAQRLNDLTAAMRAHSLSHIELMQLYIPLITKHASSGLLIQCLNSLTKQDIAEVGAEALQTCIVEGLARIRQKGATEKQRQHELYHLHTSQVISAAVGPMNAALDAAAQELSAERQNYQFQHIISQAEETHNLPIAYRSNTECMSQEERIGLVHQLAHLYSLDNTRTILQGYRSIRYLYDYLSDNSLPMGPLFTKALVKIAIFRPLSENFFVGDSRLVWVCQVVAKVEGVAAAKQVEMEFWNQRGKLIQNAKSVYVQLGGDRRDKVRVSRMKRLGLI